MFLAAVVCVFLWTTAGRAAVSRPSVFTRVISAEVQGLVVRADGRTPAAEVPVRIWDIETRQFIFETTTDANGYFELPKLEPGRYYLTFNWLKIELIVVDKTVALDQQPHDVIVIIPRGLGFVSITQMTTILMAGAITDTAIHFHKRRPPIVSP